MNNIAGTVFLILVFGLPFILLATDFIFFIIKKKSLVFEGISFLIGIVYITLAYGIWELPTYEEPLNIYSSANSHEPFSGKQWPAILLMVSVGLICYFILKFKKKKMPPLIEAFLLAGDYIGCGFCFLWIIQLIFGARPQQSAEFPLYSVRLDSYDYLEIMCLLVVPVVFILHNVKLFWTIVKEKAVEQADIEYHNSVISKLNIWLCKGANLFVFAGILLLPVLTVLAIILCVFGQQPDSMILVFTQTSDWILSKEIAPPPVAYDTHYLCTVSLRGHRKLVKPIRYGIRRGEKIVVNRQLCVANAFEELISERTPKFHKAVRNFYDTYGYPISKHIKSAWSADIVYLIMKPLEWLFLLVLYAADVKPEDRINRQYLPKNWS